MTIYRGDVFKILLILLGRKQMHGYQLIEEISLHTDGSWKPSAGAIYPALNKLKDKKFITLKIDEDNRKIASITESGRLYLLMNDLDINFLNDKFMDTYRTRIKDHLSKIREFSKCIYKESSSDKKEQLEAILCNTAKLIEDLYYDGK
ncbi:helix-turn-helix transcriptional regulator [Rosenbergiella sp. S61]|uniref:Helix-turn-helix transcriptional regulator n=1 Tax=Rosenbergiella gaditana TaxID=2726987 RepID=A0ABS5T2G2_9GAMM|nr:PadR family transcriptional regulator [Rosenbergiella gaditana]MBT0725700.1 helix-turn-helix transcriptional regulator [Rosenbergiella gaditana]